MHQPPADAPMQTAYSAAVQSFAAMGVRNLLALESDDPGVGSVVVVCHRDGAVDVTLRDGAGLPVGGYSL